MNNSESNSEISLKQILCSLIGLWHINCVVCSCQPERSQKMLGIYALFLFVIGCWGIQWRAISDFKITFKEYSETALETIDSIENLLESSRLDSESFLNNTFSKNPVLKRINMMKSSEDKCLARFIDEDNLKFSYQIQLYQLQIPLRNRVVEMRARLNDINTSLNIYQGLVESKLQSCKLVNGDCLEKTNEWLQSTIDSLSCAIQPNCLTHSINKRSTCSSGQFSCSNGACISGSFFCDSHCHCGDCSDRPPGCVRHCYEFRCQQTFRCISLNKKCNGIDECGDGSDEIGCPPPSKSSYTHANCSTHGGDFLCGSNKCIGLEKVCDGNNDCDDWSDEGDHCSTPECSPECKKKGGVCFTGPRGSECLYECPPGTYETSEGCKRDPEASLPTLLEVLEDTPRLIARYAARLKYLKTKTIMALSNALREIVKCKKDEFTLLSKIIDFSTIIQEEKGAMEDRHDISPVTIDMIDTKHTTTQEPRD